MERRENAQEREAVCGLGDGVPCCTGCGRPYAMGMYYCGHCGAAVGRYTPYVPFVNIQHNYSPFVTLVKRALRPRGLPARKAIPLYLFLAVCALIAALWVDQPVGPGKALGIGIARLVALAAVVVLVIVHIVKSVRRGDASVKAFFKTTMLYLFLLLFVFMPFVWGLHCIATGVLAWPEDWLWILGVLALLIVQTVVIMMWGNASVKTFFKTALLYLSILIFVLVPLVWGLRGIATGVLEWPRDWLAILGVLALIVVAIMIAGAAFRKKKGDQGIPYGEWEDDSIDNQSDRSEN